METLIFMLLGGHSSRMCGGSDFSLGRPWDQMIHALPYLFLPLGPVACLLAFAGAWLGKTTGHGQYLSLGRSRQHPENDERLDFIVRFFMGPQTRPDEARDLVGLLVTALAQTLPAALLLAMAGHFTAALVMALSAGAKPVLYGLNSDLSASFGWRYSSWWPEFLWGAAAWGGVAWASSLA